MEPTCDSFHADGSHMQFNILLILTHSLPLLDLDPFILSNKLQSNIGSIINVFDQKASTKTKQWSLALI